MFKCVFKRGQRTFEFYHMLSYAVQHGYRTGVSAMAKTKSSIFNSVVSFCYEIIFKWMVFLSIRNFWRKVFKPVGAVWLILNTRRDYDSEFFSLKFGQFQSRRTKINTLFSSNKKGLWRKQTTQGFFHSIAFHDEQKMREISFPTSATQCSAFSDRPSDLHKLARSEAAFLSI